MGKSNFLSLLKDAFLSGNLEGWRKKDPFSYTQALEELIRWDHSCNPIHTISLEVNRVTPTVSPVKRRKKEYKKKWTKDVILGFAKECTSLKDFREKYRNAYCAAMKYNLRRDVVGVFKKK